MITGNSIEAKTAKYIKLGEKGSWEASCIEEGVLRLGYYEVPHEMALAGDGDAIRDLFVARGVSAMSARGHARQVLDFYQAGPETIWLTFCNGQLWWCQTASPVDFQGSDREQFPDGSRARRTMAGWSGTSLEGKPLVMNNLSGRLTRVVGYRQTICDVKGVAFDYLLRKINDRNLPEVETAQAIRNDLWQAVVDLIKLLQWKDFELFVELVFSNSGWRRVSATGGAQKTIDLELVLPLTNETAVVQVKSETSQAELEVYIEALAGYRADRAFFAYHTASQGLSSDNSDVMVMDVASLADSAIRTGLVDWLIDRAG
ncbi:hypothetical protein GQF03_16490 [Sneathiella chungangensis]|uniref:Restriction endonuclease type IV Mrr domain-containing protein n=1 Tax=Sneathiella chungangensis TaxID=1418234 RepID=A0A845MJS8_9PROT|nr:restriction endonuclease [Sneathiella chungangensis]MZR23935.1 hypothetical protein [Sneathiella chungangensis]